MVNKLLLNFQSAEIKENVIKYFKEIVDVLAFVNRQMILILKTNDLLRGIESSLGTKNSMSSFIQMSRACFRIIQEKQLLASTSAFSRYKVTNVCFNKCYCFHEGGAPICGEDGLSSEYLVMKYFSTSTGPD